MNTEREIILPDGRTLAYAEFGASYGRPVMYFHGTPMSRLEPLMIGDEPLARLGIRLIAPDRPGLGRSSFQPNRGFSDWPRDVCSLADALGLERFAVMGNSGGSAYVAACAARIPDRLSGAVIVSGAWRMDWPEARNGMPFPFRVFWYLAGHSPFLFRLMLKTMAGSTRINAEKELAQFKKRVPRPDYIAFAEKPERIAALGKTMHEAMLNGTEGSAWDVRMYIREFDFRLEDVRFPITLFHGELDINVPIALVRKAVSAMPGAKLVTYENEAHLSTLCNHLDEFAKVLIGA